MNFNTSAFFNPVFEKTIAETPLKSIPFPRLTNKTPTSLLKQCEPSLLPLHTKINGTTFAEGKNLLSAIKVGMKLKLMRMPDNPFDRNAIGVYGSVNDRENVHFGFIPAEHSSKIAPIMDKGRDIQCVVTNVVGGGALNIGVRIRLS